MFRNLIIKIRSDNFLKSSFYYIFSSFFVSMLSFFSYFIILKFFLTKEDLGTISLFNTTIQFVLVICSLNVVSSVIRAKFEFKDEYNKFLSTILIFGIIAYISISTLMFLFNIHVYKFINLPTNVVFLVFFQGFSLFIFRFYMATLNAKNKYRKYSFFNIINGVGYILLSFVFLSVLDGDKYMGRIYASVTVFTLIALYSLYDILKDNKISFKWKYVKFVIFFSIPLIFDSLSGKILDSFDIFMIDRILTKNDVGMYDMAVKVGSIISIIMMGVKKTWQPWFFDKLEKENHQAIKNRYIIYIFFFWVLCIGLMFVFPEIIKLAPEEYWDGVKILPMIVMGQFFCCLYVLPSLFAFYYKKIVLVPFITILSGVLNIVLNYILLPKYGYIAASWSTAFCYGFEFFLHYLNMKYILKINLYNSWVFLMFIISFVLLQVVYMFTINFWIIRYGIILLLLFIVIVNRKKIVVLLTK